MCPSQHTGGLPVSRLRVNTILYEETLGGPRHIPHLCSWLPG